MFVFMLLKVCLIFWLFVVMLLKFVVIFLMFSVTLLTFGGIFVKFGFSTILTVFDYVTSAFLLMTCSTVTLYSGLWSFLFLNLIGVKTGRDPYAMVPFQRLPNQRHRQRRKRRVRRGLEDSMHSLLRQKGRLRKVWRWTHQQRFWLLLAILVIGPVASIYCELFFFHLKTCFILQLLLRAHFICSSVPWLTDEVQLLVSFAHVHVFFL